MLMLRLGVPALIAFLSLIVSDARAQQGAGAKTRAKQRARSSATAIDEVFATWNKSTAPGCAVGVLRDGQRLYSHGYGMADLEHGVPITPTTVFHIASVSKQFTAFAIYLLAQEGKLALDDDVRKYLPELHDFGKTITIRHLLHHISGLRDQWNLLAMAGWRLEDVITENDILRLVWRQKELNFAPGERQLYSNTGYTLLGVIVKRVSGQSLREFAQERIFKPLGMQHTHFHDEYGELVTARAHSYAQQGAAGYRYIALSYSNVGATSLFTTVEDLALWDENFYTGKVGGKDLLAQMQIKGKLNNGTEITYASALVLGTYRGLKIVEHAGGDAGFRADLLRFPDQHFSVITLCNAGEADSGGLARKVADIFLTTQMEAVTPRPTEIKIDPTKLDAYVGDYELEGGLRISFWREEGHFFTRAVGQSSALLSPISETGFLVKAFDAQVTFDKPDDSSKAPGFNLHQNGRDTRAKRLAPVNLTSEQLQAYAGTFYSDDLNTLYTVIARDGKLFLSYPRDEFEITPGAGGAFRAPFPIETVTYKCAEAKRCNSFTVSNGRVLNLRFDRIELKAGSLAPLTPARR
jgi:CubicO group peptidase (beta-lactamase class C family)